MLAGSLSFLSVSETTYCTAFGLPVKPLSGVKRTLPSARTSQVPSPATFSVVTFSPVAGSTSLTVVGTMVSLPCLSVSLARTSTVTGSPLVPFMVSALATGASSPGCGCGFGGVTASSGAVMLASALVLVPSPLCALTVLPSLTSFGGSVTLPVAVSTSTSFGRVSFAAHWPLASLVTVMVFDCPVSSVYSTVSVVAFVSGVMTTPPWCAVSAAIAGALMVGALPSSFGATALASLLSVPWASAFFATTVLPSLTSFGGSVTLPVVASTATSFGRVSFAAHWPLASLVTVMVFDWPVSSV